VERTESLLSAIDAEWCEHISHAEPAELERLSDAMFAVEELTTTTQSEDAVALVEGLLQCFDVCGGGGGGGAAATAAAATAAAATAAAATAAAAIAAAATAASTSAAVLEPSLENADGLEDSTVDSPEEGIPGPFCVGESLNRELDQLWRNKGLSLISGKALQQEAEAVGITEALPPTPWVLEEAEGRVREALRKQKQQPHTPVRPVQ